MKILKISFKNIHSLEGKHTIDFEDKRFTQTNLFAITGATGSGKSTILDVISLALYNQMPRMFKISPNEIQKNGAIITHGKTDAYARVMYHCPKGVFISEWSIRIKRTGAIDNIQMQLYDIHGTPLGQNRQDIPKANAENIGLSYEQFIKSVMLAQGDFALFLKVSKKERSALLEQITGTEIYRILGKMAFEKNKESKIRLKSLEDSKLLFQQKILPKELYLSKKQELTHNETTLIVLQKELSILENQRAVKEKLAKILQKITDIEVEINQKIEKLNIFQQKKGERLELHKKTESFSEDLLQWKNITELLEQNNNKLLQKKSEKDDFFVKKTNFLIEVQSFIQKKCNETQLSEEMEAFRQEILTLQAQKSEKQLDFRNQTLLLSSLLKPLYIEIDGKTNFTELKRSLVEKIEIYHNEKMTLKTQLYEYNLQEIEQEITLLQEQIKSIQKAEKIAVDILQKHQFVIEKQQKIAQLEADIFSFPTEINTLKIQQEAQSKALKYLRIEKENADLKKSLEAHRSQLIEGKPCPLCGSVHHPWSNMPDNEKDTLSEQIFNQEKELENLQKKLVVKESKLSITNTTIKTLNSEIFILNEEILEKEKKFSNDYLTYQLTDNWEKLQSANEEKIQLLKKYEQLDTQFKSLQNSLPIVNNILKIIQIGIEIGAKLEKKIGKYNVNEKISTYQSFWNNLQAKISINQQQIKDLEVNQAIYKNQKKQLDDELNSKVFVQNFASITEALSARLPFEEANQLMKEKQELEGAIKTLQTQKEILDTDFQEVKNQDIVESMENLVQNIEQKYIKNKEINKNIEEIRFILRNNDQNQQEIDELEQKIKQEIEKNRSWRLLDMLIGDATGAKFNQFAQDLTLQQLIQLANRRLVRLSPRYILSQPSENEDDSLVIIDNDMGQKRRSVKTLSGGETFILSLSLALALSDLASNNVKISSLFIDEGFGTLDPETLDQTLDTLERLQQESDKMIGVISHVEALKERISTQIQLKQKGSGFSTLTVIPH